MSLVDGVDVRVSLGFRGGRGGQESKEAPEAASQKAKDRAARRHATCTEYRPTTGERRERMTELKKYNLGILLKLYLTLSISLDKKTLGILKRSKQGTRHGGWWQTRIRGSLKFMAVNDSRLDQLLNKDYLNSE